MTQMARFNSGRLTRIVALGATLVMATAGSTMAGLDTGQLPPAGFTHSSLIDGIVEPTARTMPTPDSLVDVYAWLASTQWATDGSLADVGVDIDTVGPIAVETTYTLQEADLLYRLGWHVNSGPVIVTVTAGTLTIVDDTCQTFDLVAGQSYIEPTGEAFGALVLPEKNPEGAAVGWFTTRLFPQGAVAVVEVGAPCVM